MTAVRAPRALAAGFRFALARPGIVCGIYGLSVAVALAAALPAFAWLNGSTATRPTADRMLAGFSLPIFVDIVRTAPASILATLNASIGASLLLTILSAPLLLGLVSAALAAPAAGPGELARAAARRYWRLLALTTIGRGVAVLLALLVGAAAGVAVTPIKNSSLETASLLALAVVGGSTLAVAALGWAAVDVGTMTLVTDDSVGALRAWWRGVRFVVRRPVLTLAAWATLALIAAGSAALLYAAMLVWPATTVAAIAVAIALQQIVVVVRVLSRVAVLGAEWRASEPWRTVPIAVPAAVTQVAVSAPAAASVAATPVAEPVATPLARAPLVGGEENPGPGQDGEGEVEQREDRE